MSEVTVSISLTKKEQGALYMAHLDAKKTIKELIARRDALEAVLEHIARPHDCGCVPCTGDCISQLSTVDEIRDLAKSAIASTPK